MLLPLQGATAPTRDTQGVATLALCAPLGLQPVLAKSGITQGVAALALCTIGPSARPC